MESCDGYAKNGLYYVEKGQGDVFVLLHGNGEDHGYFKNQIDFFAKDYRVIAIDTRGHGKSARGDKEITILQAAEDLKSFLDEKEIKRIHLLGFSDGGNIGLVFALKYPGYVKTLTLNGANLSPAGVKVSVQFPIVCAYLLVSAITVVKKKLTQKKEILGLMVKEPHIRLDQLKRLRMPVLVIVGTKDMIRHSHSRMIYEHLPKGAWCCMKGTHFIAGEDPENFNHNVEHFLKEHKSRC